MKKTLALGLIASVAIALAGCTDSDAPPTPDTTTDGELRPVRVAALPITETAALWGGIEAGIFERHGLEVEVLPAQGGAFAIPAMINRLASLEAALETERDLLSQLEDGLAAMQREAAEDAMDQAPSMWAAERERQLDELAGDLGLKDAEITILHVGITSLRERVKQVVVAHLVSAAPSAPKKSNLRPRQARVGGGPSQPKTSVIFDASWSK